MTKGAKLCKPCGLFRMDLVPVTRGSQTMVCKDCRRGIRHSAKVARAWYAAQPKPTAAEVAANRAELLARVARKGA